MATTRKSQRTAAIGGTTIEREPFAADRPPPRAERHTPDQADLTDRIRARAYEIFESRQVIGRQGDALSDWLQAESELSKPSQPMPAVRKPAPEPTHIDGIPQLVVKSRKQTLADRYL